MSPNCSYKVLEKVASCDSIVLTDPACILDID
jgi:hypothetical protein